MINGKEHLYKTAKAEVACAHFNAGDFVSVEFYGNYDGRNWFLVRKSQRGDIANPVAYPEHHLSQFCL